MSGRNDDLREHRESMARALEPTFQGWLDWCGKNNEEPEALSAAQIAVAYFFPALADAEDDARGVLEHAANAEERARVAEARVAKLEAALRPFAEFAADKVWRGTPWAYKEPCTAVLHSHATGLEIARSDFDRAAALLDHRTDATEETGRG